MGLQRVGWEGPVAGLRGCSRLSPAPQGSLEGWQGAVGLPVLMMELADTPTPGLGAGAAQAERPAPTPHSSGVGWILGLGGSSAGLSVLPVGHGSWAGVGAAPPPVRAGKGLPAEHPHGAGEGASSGHSPGVGCSLAGPGRWGSVVSGKAAGSPPARPGSWLSALDAVSVPRSPGLAPAEGSRRGWCLQPEGAQQGGQRLPALCPPPNGLPGC
ncbi:hypothetical protein KIL84_000370 [Mauremys mutica]|uniref:Uncharacterized protein n=1 Tax=Mauremys mutica TaxID=74926 RepID=A0A9D4B3C3_9SAUR|nr:hypothetical protein KIL84_000370 [Mauremys mutica]